MDYINIFNDLQFYFSYINIFNDLSLTPEGSGRRILFEKTISKRGI